jgi:DNA-binding transcriptional ArsR family regulator
MELTGAATVQDLLAEMFDSLSQPARLQILMVIREQPACVCHIEAVLGLRQASISQHLMMLRQAGLVTASRQGRNMFYSIALPQLPDLIEQVARVRGWSVEDLFTLACRPICGCTCPQCRPDLPPELCCKPLST